MTKYSGAVMNKKLGTYKVTIVDDEKDLVYFLKIYLEGNNFAVSYSYNGRDGLNVIRKERPDVIILDIIMPEIDGRDVMIELKKNEATKNIPVIFLTAKTEQFERNYGFELKADGYIEKPYDHDMLLREVMRVILKSKNTSR